MFDNRFFRLFGSVITIIVFFVTSFAGKDRIMANMSSYTVNPGWRLLLTDLGIRPDNVLRRAGLPGDLFGREKAVLSTDEYFRVWRALEEESEDPALPLRIGAAISVEAFDPPIFAALCSPDLNTALGRIARYKRLVCPMALHVEMGEKATTLELKWLDAIVEPPVSLVAAELVFFVQLARIATRKRIIPLQVRAPHPPKPKKEYAEYFGVALRKGSSPVIAFKAADAALPFLTANEKMWRFFEPDLQKRLSELDESASTAQRVHAAFLELLPSGAASIESVSRKLGTSTRTLQRRLKEEGRSFQGVLNETREGLARHYLRTPNLSGAEISFLLGFEDPNSFFRAFRTWTGETPEQVRSAMYGRR
jgi:AraC-like DNA-binding protein